MQTLEAGTKLGSYTIVRLVGRGGMGEVYEAYEHSLDRRVALKVISAQKVGSRGEVDLIRRFLQEARTLAQVNHPNVVTIHAIDRIDNIQFIAMEFVEGALLSDLFSMFAFSADEATPMFFQLLKGMRALHDKQILHRDIKPHNLMLRPDGQIKILDFGIAKRVGDAEHEKADKSKKLVGTLAYLPPEVVNGSRADIRSDLWSLGAIFYECLVGQPLVSLTKTRVIGVRATAESDVVIPEEALTRIPVEMRVIIAKLCAQNPEHRYATVREVLEDLKNYQSSRTPLAPHFAQALAKTVDNIEDVKLNVDRAQLPDAAAKRAFAGMLLNASGASGPGQLALVSIMTPKKVVVPNTDDTLYAVTKDSISARQKARRSLRRRRRARSKPLWATAVATAAIGAFVFWYVTTSTIVPPFAAVRQAKIVLPPPPVPTKTAPVLLLSPEKSEVLWLEAEQTPTLKWSQNIPVDQYQLQISNEEDFKTILIGEAVSGNFYRPTHVLEEGDYFWRLYPGGSQPIIGPSKFSLRSLAPIKLLMPGLNQEFEVPRSVKTFDMELRWKCRPSVQSYLAQLSRDPSFRKSIREQVTPSCTWNSLHLPVGNYYWRVKMQEPSSHFGWSPIGSFAIKQKAPDIQVLSQVVRKAPVKKIPVVAKKYVSGPRILHPIQSFTLKFRSPEEQGREVASQRPLPTAVPSLSWAPMAGARSYRVEIAKDSGFTSVIEQKNVGKQTQFEWKKASPGPIFWRVISIGDAEGLSKTGQLDVRLPAPLLMSTYSYNDETYFEWDPVPYAEKYIVQSSPERKPADWNEKVTDRAQVPLKMNGGLLYVRIAVANRSGKRVSEFSRIARVTTAPK